jgi:urease accessory protein UreH
MAGREGRGERWVFETLAHELAVWRGGSLIYLERFRLEPAVQVIESRWVTSDSCYFGTVLAVGVPARAGKLQDDLSSFDGIRAAVDSISTDVALVRLMAQRGTAFHDARAVVRRCLCA